MQRKPRNIIGAITILYTLFILYILFFAFGRADKSAAISEYTFIFMPDSFFRIPGLSDLLHPSLMTVVDFGNIAAFIPFGILFPLLYRTGFVRFISWFILSILVLETIQALTFLGSFDVNDVIQNSLGAAIGFAAYKLGFRTASLWKNAAVTVGISIVIMLGVIGIFGMVDRAFTKEPGPFVSISEMKDDSGAPVSGTKGYRFQMNGQHVEPEYNVYRAGDKPDQTFTYTFDDEDELHFFLNYGIPDDQELQGSLRVIIDGHEYLTVSPEYLRREPDMFKIGLTQAREIRIILDGNMTVWDVGFREMGYFWE